MKMMKIYSKFNIRNKIMYDIIYLSVLKIVIKY